MKILKSLLSLLLIAVFLLGIAACGKAGQPSDLQTNTESSSDASQTETDQGTPEPEPAPILYENPLTGLPTTVDTTRKRPAAIMLNNIKQSLPQEGISDVEILFECLVEGNITRLMGLFSDYGALGEIGSIRSARPYYLDFAQAFDAIFCHAGGSNQAYDEIRTRKISNVDGVQKDPLRVYYRDKERLKTMDLEHTMMTTGEGIVKSVEHFKYRTTLRDNFALPFEFPQPGTSVAVGTEDALHVYLPVSSYQVVDYVYNTESKEYLRYQYNGQRHVDGNNDRQLSFTNVIVLFCKTVTIDDAGRLGITTTGTGKGYLISQGKYTPITWSRTDRDGNLTLTDTATGSPLVINRGKTAVNVCPLSVENKINLNATDRIINP